MSVLQKLMNVKAWPRYAMLLKPKVWRNRQALKFVENGQPIVKLRVNDLDLYVDLRDTLGIAKKLYVNRAYDPDETIMFSRVLRPGMTFVDIGANIGYFTTLGAKLVGPSGRVIAFEPDPGNFALLEKNVTQNHLSQVALMNMALGAESGKALLYKSPNNYGDHRLYNGTADRDASVEVRVEALDTVLDDLKCDRIDVIKMDVQGYETYVLAGMKKTLSRASLIMAEYWPYGLELAGSSGEAFLRIFRDANFTIHHLREDGSDHPIGWDDVTGLLPTQVNSPGAKFVNLIFRRPEATP
jgi:FkbM family methyltransferase